MKRTTLILLAAISYMATFGQNVGDSYAKYASAVEFQTKRFSLDDARQIVLDIVREMELEESFIVKEGRVKNIEASIKRKKKQIIYNPEFISRLQKVSNNRWTIVAIFAHEVGHHLKGHTGKKSGSRPHLELEADEFAGYVLQKMGASLEESVVVMQYIAAYKGSKTHPGRSDRTLAIQNGWMRGNMGTVKSDRELKTDGETSRPSGTIN